MLPLNNTLGERGVLSGVWGGFDEYSQAVSREIVVNYLFFLPLCLLGFVGSASGKNGPSCAAHLLGSR